MTNILLVLQGLGVGTVGRPDIFFPRILGSNAVIGIFLSNSFLSIHVKYLEGEMTLSV